MSGSPSRGIFMCSIELLGEVDGSRHVSAPIIDSMDLEKDGIASSMGSQEL